LYCCELLWWNGIAPRGGSFELLVREVDWRSSSEGCDHGGRGCCLG
jgi:hypothetical protein